MVSPTRAVVDFVMRTKFEDLPQQIVNEVNLLVLDSIGCALAGQKTAKANYGMAMAKKLGGPPEATIWGTRDKVSCAAAAFANGERINALDWDAFTLPTHAPPIVVPAVLSVAENAKASGKQTVLALAIGFELTQRLGSSITGTHMKVFFDKADTGPKLGQITGTKYICAVVNPPVMASAAGLGKLLQFDSEKMANVIGVGCHFSPVPHAKWLHSDPGPMTKYIVCGWGALSAVTAAQLAEMGFTSDTEVLDGDLGFWRTYGSGVWEPSVLTGNLGKEWIFPQHLMYKHFPCNGFYPTSLNCFNKIIDENNISPDDIQEIRIQSYMGPWPLPPRDLMKTVKSHVHAEFHTPYVFALNAHKVDLAHWQDEEMMNDPQIHKFMDRVSVKVSVHPDFWKVRDKEPGANMTTVEVVARGKTFKEEGKFHKLAPTRELAHLNADDLVKKFNNATADVLSKDKASQAIDTILKLEQVKDISEVIKQVSS